MTLIVTSSSDDTIAIPVWLMKALNLRDGTSVKATIEGQLLSLSPIAEFLAPRGLFHDDDSLLNRLHADNIASAIILFLWLWRTVS